MVLTWNYDRFRLVKSRGFSLLEVVVGLTIIALMVGMAAMGFSGGNEKLDSSSMAKIVHDQMVLARTRARAIGQPVGVAFPGAGTYGAQALYQLSGVNSMKIQKPRDFSSEFSRSYVVWAPVGSESTSDRLAVAPYDIAAMTGLVADDPLVLFLPDGQILARGLPFDGNNYHLRVGSRPSGGPGGLTGLSNAWDISIHTTGAVSLKRDTAVGPGTGSSLTTAALPSPSAPPTSLPVVTSLKTFPELVDNATGLVLATPEEPVNLLVEAQSPNGLPLQVRWSAGGGQFSDSGDWLPMTYSQDDNLWKASIMWSLPQSPAALERVNVEVRDEFGNASASSSVSELVFDTANAFPWELFFVSRTASSLVADVERMNGDGSGRVAILENETRPPEILVSPNGELFAWKSGDYTLDRQIMVSARDGTLLRTITFPRQIDGPLVWSPDSTFFLVNDIGVSPTTVWRANPSTGAFSVYCTLPTQATLYSASDNLRYFAYRNQTDRDEARVYDNVAGVERLVYKGPAGTYGPVDIQLSAEGNYCGFYDQIPSGYRTILAKTDGTGHLDLGYGDVAYVSPDESTVCFNRRSAPRGGTYTFVVANIDGTVRYTDPDMTDYSLCYSPDSRFVVKIARSFSDYRLLAMELTSGNILEICEDDGLNKFRLNLAVPRR